VDVDSSQEKKGHTLTSTQLSLLREVKTWLPDGLKVVLRGDSEFGRPLLLEEFDFWGGSISYGNLGT
jgi:hypothetical protein